MHVTVLKQGRVKLTGDAYQAFKREVHEADNWRCTICGRITALTVHHLIKRSQLRLDTLENCISACVDDHEAIERGHITVAWEEVSTRRLRVGRGREGWADGPGQAFNVAKKAGVRFITVNRGGRKRIIPVRE